MAKSSPKSVDTARAWKKTENHPSSLYDKLASHEICPVGFVLLCLISDLAAAGGWRATGFGCYASNAYLGRRIAKSARYVQTVLADLKTKNLIYVSNVDKEDGSAMRTMDVYWRVTSTNNGGDDPQIVGGTIHRSPYNTVNPELKKIQCDSAAPNTHGENSRMPLGFVNNKASGDTPPSKRSTPGAVAMKVATKLKASLREQGKGGASRVTTWARQFQLCIDNELGGEAARLEVAMDWYCTQLPLKPKYLPLAYCAESFRRKLVQIEDAIKRDAERNPQAQVSPAARKAVEQASSLKWPPSIKDKLPLHAQIVIDRYSPVRIHIQEYVRKHADKSNLSRACARLLAHLPAPDQYAALYLTEVVHNRVTWAKFNGDLTSLFWTPDCEHFVSRCVKALTAYGAPQLWDRVREIMK